MYNVSDDYLRAVALAGRPYDTVYGTVTFTDETTMDVDASVMPINGITISKQCIDSKELMFGGVFLSTLNLSLFTDKDRYAFFGAKVELTYQIRIGGTYESPIYEEVPLGIFEVADADRPNADMVKLTAYDKLRMLDIEIGADVLQGRPWLIFQQVEEKTGIELAFEEEDLENFVNTETTLQIDSTRGCKTYRDVVKVVCQLMGCFACASRDGKLEIREFGETVVRTLGYSDDDRVSMWYSINPADYICNYVALSVTGLGGTFKATSDDPDEIGNTMVISDAPAWDYGLDETLQEQTDNLFNYLHGIAYTPGTLTVPDDPSYDCGDRLELLTNKGIVETIITSYEWTLDGGTKITSEGTNPYLEGASTRDISSTRILNQNVSENKVQFFNFTNEIAHIIGDTETALIGSLKFVAVTKTNAMFIATILVDIDVDDIEVETVEEVTVPVKVFNELEEEVVLKDELGNPVHFMGTAEVTHLYKRDGHMTATIFYSLNDVVFDYQAIDNLTAGRHIISVEHPITSLDTNSMYEWKIFMLSGDGQITVPQNSMRATIFGQGITDAVGWDGNIEVSDDIEHTAIAPLTVIPLYEGAPTVVTTEENLYNYSDGVTPQAMGAIVPMTLEDNVNVTIKELDWIWRSGENYSGDDANLL